MGVRGPVTDKAASELGYIIFSRSCFVWCVETIDGYLKAVTSLAGKADSPINPSFLKRAQESHVQHKMASALLVQRRQRVTGSA
jgi:hypothetical protein